MKCDLDIRGDLYSNIVLVSLITKYRKASQVDVGFLGRRKHNVPRNSRQDAK